jgi:hypothetical protein
MVSPPNIKCVENDTWEGVGFYLSYNFDESEDFY